MFFIWSFAILRNSPKLNLSLPFAVCRLMKSLQKLREIGATF